MSLEKKVKDFFRPTRDILYTFFGFVYDFLRFFRYSGWALKSRSSVRDFKAVKIYHRLEKSLSFRNRDPASGWGAADDLVSQLQRNKATKCGFSYHEKVGLKVLGDFIKESDGHNVNHKEASRIIKFWEANKEASADEGGVLVKTSLSLQSGKLANPEEFFLSRYSVRDFDSKRIPIEVIEQAISLALNTPSVCNRQASFVYCLDTHEEINKALLLQNGSRGFGHEIPCLLVLCADLSAFDTSGERYQQWIDGGMFSMSVIWALHSLGLSSCCLNWSKGPVDDLRLRKMVDIKNEHTVLMMLAVGVPRESIKVCYSARKNLKDFYKKLD